MKKIFLLDGPNGTGKTDMVEYIKAKHKDNGSISILPKFSTRKKRLEEENKNLDLKFISKAQFQMLKFNDNFYQYEYGSNGYGFYKNEIVKKMKSVDNLFIVVRNKRVSEQIIKDFPECIVVLVYIYTDPEKIKPRLLKEKVCDEAVNFRLARTNTSWQDYLTRTHEYSEVIINNSTIEDYHILIDYLVKKYNRIKSKVLVAQ